MGLTADLTFIFRADRSSRVRVHNEPHQISLLRLEQNSCFQNRTRDHKTTKSRTIKTVSRISTELSPKNRRRKQSPGWWVRPLAQPSPSGTCASSTCTAARSSSHTRRRCVCPRVHLVPSCVEATSLCSRSGSAPQSGGFRGEALNVLQNQSVPHTARMPDPPPAGGLQRAGAERYETRRSAGRPGSRGPTSLCGPSWVLDASGQIYCQILCCSHHCPPSLRTHTGRPGPDVPDPPPARPQNSCCR